MARAMVLLGCALLILVAGCTSQPQLRFSTEQVAQAIANWLECDECTDHELHHVVILGESAKEPLEALIETPSRAFTPEREASLRERHRDLVAAFPSLRHSEDKYVSVHMSAHGNRVRARAATALRLINPGALDDRELVRIRTVPR